MYNSLNSSENLEVNDTKVKPNLIEELRELLEDKSKEDSIILQGDSKITRSYFMSGFFNEADLKYKNKYNLYLPAVFIKNFLSRKCKNGILDNVDLKNVREYILTLVLFKFWRHKENFEKKDGFCP